jgi:hypothetical protein
MDTQRETLWRCSHCGTLNYPHQNACVSCNLLRLPLHSPTDASPLAAQVGGQHYKAFKIQPVEYIHANSIPFIEGNVIKYVSRWRSKGGPADLEKARHFIDMLIELEGKANAS